MYNAVRTLYVWDTFLIQRTSTTLSMLRLLYAARLRYSSNLKQLAIYNNVIGHVWPPVRVPVAAISCSHVRIKKTKDHERHEQRHIKDFLPSGT